MFLSAKLRISFANIGKAVLLCAAISSTPGCDAVTGGNVYPSYRYRLTVEVETPQGLRSGSSVIEVRVRRAGSTEIPNPNQMFNEVIGQAVAVDLPQGQTLFALLRSDDSRDWASFALQNAAQPMTSEEAVVLSQAGKDPFEVLMQRTLALRGRHDVPRWLSLPDYPPSRPRVSGWPMMVRFTNIRDPRTVQPVDPDDLSTSFGKGYAIRRVTVERTEEAVTRGIEKILPSFGPETGFTKWYRSLTYGDPRMIDLDDFTRG